jgi:hypothetical protein
VQSYRARQSFLIRSNAVYEKDLQIKSAQEFSGWYNRGTVELLEYRVTSGGGAQMMIWADA